MSTVEGLRAFGSSSLQWCVEDLSGWGRFRGKSDLNEPIGITVGRQFTVVRIFILVVAAFWLFITTQDEKDIYGMVKQLGSSTRYGLFPMFGRVIGFAKQGQISR
jgi:hypothetical protein